MSKKISREKKTVEAMVGIYCRGNEHICQKKGLCGACSDLLRYANERLDQCVFGEEKPSCAACPVHCYQKSRRDEIALVMRYAGPKMPFLHPYLALRHFFVDNKKRGKKAQEYLERRNSRTVKGR